MPASRTPRHRRSRRARREVIPLRPIPSGRMRLVFGMLCVGLVGLIFRMAWLQVLQAPALEARARAFQTQRTSPLGKRYPIVDRTGRLVAIDEERFRLWAHPRYFNLPGDEPSLIRSPIDIAGKLSGLLSIPTRELVKNADYLKNCNFFMEYVRSF